MEDVEGVGDDLDSEEVREVLPCCCMRESCSGSKVRAMDVRCTGTDDDDDELVVTEPESKEPMLPL